jgi:hypothetical protein
MACGSAGLTDRREGLKYFVSHVLSQHVPQNYADTINSNRRMGLAWTAFLTALCKKCCKRNNFNGNRTLTSGSATFCAVELPRGEATTFDHETDGLQTTYEGSKTVESVNTRYSGQGVRGKIIIVMQSETEPLCLSCPGSHSSVSEKWR